MAITDQLFTQLLEFGVLSMILAALVGIVTRRLRLPYTIGLVLMGLVLSLLNSLNLLQATPVDPIIDFAIDQISANFILGLLVTPLIFEAAFHLRWDKLRREMPFILTLAIPGVALTMLLVASILFIGADLSGSELTFPVTLLFGAMMAATDPVAVIALFKYLGVPKRLQVLMEGESLFNDGTAIVAFTMVASLALNPITAAGGSDHPLWMELITEFLTVAGGGLLTGLALGWLGSRLISRVDDPLIETTLTTVLAFGSFLLAESFEVSGILAVVAAGLASGSVGPKGMSPTTRILVTNFWDFLAFASNSIIFLLIGLEIDLIEMTTQIPLILLAILAVLAARGVVIYAISPLAGNIPRKWRHVLWWGGLRGAITLVLALSLNPSLPSSLEIKNMAFGVVLFTILVQSLTMRPLVRRLHLIVRSENQEEYERRHARSVAVRYSYQHLKEMYQEGLFSQHTWEIMAPRLEEYSDGMAKAVKEVLEFDPDVEAEELDTARREVLRAQRSALVDLLKDGVIIEEVYWQLTREVDEQLSRKKDEWIPKLMDKRQEDSTINLLMAVVVQIQDAENAMRALTTSGLSVTRLPSSGGFLGRSNITLLIALSKGQEERAVAALRSSCQMRVDYIPAPVKGLPSHPPPMPVNIGGAVIFTLEVEHYEEL